MNKINLQQTGGFPLETDTLDYMQNAYSALQVITALGGDNYILSGCIATGSNVGNGFVVINGEVLEFRGGSVQTNMVIREEKQTRPFENGQAKEVFITRYVTFGTGTDAIPFANLLRLKPLSVFKDLPTTISSALDLDDENTLATAKAVKLLNDKVESKLPAGCILIWSGQINVIPAGWALCDGQNGTPNLTDKFVLGAGSKYYVGQSGGEEMHKLTIAEMPRHSHSYTKYDEGPNNTGDNDDFQGFINANTSETGGDQPHNNMPPYYALAYIIKF